MKTVFRNNSEVAHAWASRSQSEGRAGNLSFRDGALISYFTPVAKIHADAAGNPVALFSAETYSPTTSRHLYEARHAWRGNGDSFTVPTIGAIGGWGIEFSNLPDHAANLAHFRAKYDAAALCFRRQRDDLPAGQFDARLTDLANDSREYARAFALPVPEFSPEADADEIAAFRAARRARLDTPAAAAKRERARLAREAKAERARELAALKDSEKLAAWLAGEPVTLPYGAQRHPDSGSCYLRRKDSKVQTSQGVSVPLDHAERLYRFAAACRERGEGFTANGHKFAVGIFAVSRITASGDITAGCHLIEWAEAERFAKLEGWAS